MTDPSTTTASGALAERCAAGLARLVAASGARRLLVAWSGGLDSTVLLHLALEFARARDLAIATVHVD
ncbi:MAG: hypothetical protein RKL32_18030, partial [Gammaproteobacteria bacterium]